MITAYRLRYLTGETWDAALCERCADRREEHATQTGDEHPIDLGAVEAGTSCDDCGAG